MAHLHRTLSCLSLFRTPSSPLIKKGKITTFGKWENESGPQKVFQVFFFRMFERCPALPGMRWGTDSSSNWLNSDGYCVFHMAWLHELGTLCSQTVVSCQICVCTEQQIPNERCSEVYLYSGFLSDITNCVTIRENTRNFSGKAKQRQV